MFRPVLKGKQHLACPLLMALGLLSGCASETVQQETLASLDISDASALQADVFVPHKTEEEIKQSYYRYINDARTDDRARLLAMTRLADMEIIKAHAAIRESDRENLVDTQDDDYVRSLEKTRDLLEMSARDFPDDPKSDQILYRLARVQDHLGDAEASMHTLTELVSRFPTSPYYAEAQFRLAERAFVSGDYIAAEDAYTEVIYALNNTNFRQRAYFKRGWARYKQGLYASAAEDHVSALQELRFTGYDALDSNERGVFDEHFRALALTFAHVGDKSALYSIFESSHKDAFLYHTCRALSDIYLSQERFSDAASVLSDLVAKAPNSVYAAQAHLQVVEIWRRSPFWHRYMDELENFYVTSGPASVSWGRKTEPLDATVLKEHVLRAAASTHKEYLEHKSPAALQKAALWYDRYLTSFAAHARKDNIHMLYGDLLAAADRNIDALQEYEKAAFDGSIILDKTAAYAAINLTYELYSDAEQNNHWLHRHLEYATRYARLYPNDTHTETIALHGAELAFTAGAYEQALTLSRLLPRKADKKNRRTAQLITARSLLATEQFVEAENILTDLLATVEEEQKGMVQDNLALTLYKQGDHAQQQNEPANAIEFYARVAKQAPSSDIAPQALYDAIVLAMDNQLWPTAITHMQTFQRQFPTHVNAGDVARRLSTAYIQSEQYAEAAQALEKVSVQTADAEVQMAALWQAAELYENEGKWDAAIRTYRSYAHTYKRPFPQNMEAMHKLAQLYNAKQDNYRRNFWHEKIVASDRKTPSSSKTTRTNFIAASAWLALARHEQEAFEQVALKAPLAENLRKKKQHMEKAIELYSNASSYNLAEVSTESTFAIASSYRHFATALLQSERPPNLTPNELAQYDILIEDQAYPFEEMAIQFHEINVGRIAKGTVNDWVTSSMEQLQALFPVRYARQGKLALYAGDQH